MEVSGSGWWLVAVGTQTTVAHWKGEFGGEQEHWGARKQGSSRFNCHGVSSIGMRELGRVLQGGGRQGCHSFETNSVRRFGLY